VPEKFLAGDNAFLPTNDQALAGAGAGRDRL